MRIVALLLFTMVVAFFFGAEDASTKDVHAQLQQYLLEAEFGSAIPVSFAKKYRAPLPSSKPLDKVINELKSSSAEQRWDAADELVLRKDPLAVAAIIDAMLDPGGTRRVCVMARALGHFKDPRALSALTEAAFDKNNRDLRLCAIQSLGMIGDPKVVPDLIKALSSHNMPIAAANALAQLGDERAVNALIEFSKQNEPLRLWMIAALGELGNASAIQYLQQVEASDTKRSIKRAAHEALWKISSLSVQQPQRALQQVLINDDSDEHRGWAAFRLGDLVDAHSIPVLIEALQDDNERVSGKVAAALVRAGKVSLPLIRTAVTRDGHSVYLDAILGYVGESVDADGLRKRASEISLLSAKMITRRVQPVVFEEL